MWVDQSCVKEITEKPENIAIISAAVALGNSWRGDKNYQSKAGQAFQGVELKKIEG